MNQEQYDLKALREAATNACDKAIRKRRRNRQCFINDAINWADLSCRSAEYCLDDEGQRYYRVWLEEAAPEAAELCAYIARELEQAGFRDVEVCMEW